MSEICLVTWAACCKEQRNHAEGELAVVRKPPDSQTGVGWPGCNPGLALLLSEWWEGSVLPQKLVRGIIEVPL